VAVRAEWYSLWGPFFRLPVRVQAWLILLTWAAGLWLVGLCAWTHWQLWTTPGSEWSRLAFDRWLLAKALCGLVGVFVVWFGLEWSMWLTRPGNAGREPNWPRWPDAPPDGERWGPIDPPEPSPVPAVPDPSPPSLVAHAVAAD
jgi:hypothetical protein